jgi:hypothetical protein
MIDQCLQIGTVLTGDRAEVACLEVIDQISAGQVNQFIPEAFDYRRIYCIYDIPHLVKAVRTIVNHAGGTGSKFLGYYRIGGIFIPGVSCLQLGSAIYKRKKYNQN